MTTEQHTKRQHLKELIELAGFILLLSSPALLIAIVNSPRF